METQNSTQSKLKTKHKSFVFKFSFGYTHFWTVKPKTKHKLNTTHKTKRVSTDGPGDSGQLGPSIKKIQTAKKHVSTKLNLNTKLNTKLNSKLNTN